MRFRSRLLFTLACICTSIIAVTADNSGRDVLSDTNAKGEVRRWDITGPWGGDVRALVASPADADTLYLGTGDGQVFRTTDGARTWRRLKPGIKKRGISVDNIVIDPRNLQVIYAGTWAVGEGNDDEQGVYKSEDGGEHWKLLKETKGLNILSLAIAPSDSNFLIAGARTGVYRSTDGGDDWERISPEGHAEIRNVNSAAIDPIDTNIVFIGTHHLPWKTTDGGKAWKQTGYKAVGMIDDTDIMGISINPTDRSLVYINGCSGIYRSTSAGEKWFKIPGIPFSARRTYALLPHPTQPNVIFAGTSEGLWRTKDGGKKWMLLTSKNVVVRALVVHPSKPNRVLIATEDFGVRASDTLGDDFTDANMGFIHRHILAIMPDGTERGRVLASVFHDGLSGSVFSSVDGGESWQPSSRGMGPRDVFAFYQVPDSPNVIYAGTNAGVFKSNDRGASWSFVGQEKPKKEEPAKKPARRRRAQSQLTDGGALSTTLALSSAQVGRYETVAAQRRSAKKPAARPSKLAQKKPAQKKPSPKVVEPAGPGMVELTRQVDGLTSFVDSQGRRGLIAATMDGIYRTVDENKGWEKVMIAGYPLNGRVFAVSSHKDTPGKIYAGTKQGLYISKDAGLTWEQIERGPNDVSVKAIVQHPADPDLILLGTNHYIYRSTNAGRTWTRRGGGLPSGDYTSVVINPTNPDEVMATEYSRGGIFRSTDKGYFWERIDTDLPSHRVWTLMFDPFDRDRVYAGSFSSGVYVLTIQRGAMNTGQ